MDPTPTEAVANGPLKISSAAAVQWFKIIGAYVAALTALSLALTRLIDPLEKRFPNSPYWLWYIIAALPLMVAFVRYGIPSWVKGRREAKLKDWGVGEGSASKARYFRVAPYENTKEDRDQYARADQAHEQTLAWLKDGEETALYLTGLSGSGKSSLLMAYVLPKLKEAVPTINSVVLRSFDDPLTSLSKQLLEQGVSHKATHDASDPRTVIALLKKACKGPGRTDLLLVFDQFEEFLIIHENDERRLKTLKDLLLSLHEEPVPGVRVLLVFRSDYLGLIQAFVRDQKFPPMEMYRNWRDISPFRQRDARDFLQQSGLEVGPALMEDIFRQIADIEKAPGQIRPITLNMFGLVLEDAARPQGPPLTRRRDTGGLLNDYLQSCISSSYLRYDAPSILSRMITRRRTTEAKSVATLAKQTGFREDTVTGCLLLLQMKGLVRCLDKQNNIWEISHDFVAELLENVLHSWRRTFWRVIRASLWPLAVLVWALVFLILPYVQRADNPAGPFTLSPAKTPSPAHTPSPILTPSGVAWVTDDELRLIMPNCPAWRRVDYLPYIQAAMGEFEITTYWRKAAFLAQLAHESSELEKMEDAASGAAYEGRKALGNTEPGDGMRYKGRGPFLLAGRANYQKYAALLGVDLIHDPTLAATSQVGFRIAGEFWKLNRLNELADQQKFETITRLINGGLNGQADRVKYYIRAKEVLKPNDALMTAPDGDSTRPAAPGPAPP